jgi:prevent-host-death family protein
MAVTTKNILEKRIGIRQFRDGLTRHLGQVRRGARITITDRGNPVALVLPYEKDEKPGQQERMRELLASGHVAPADRPFLARLPAAKGKGALPSRLIIEERR